METRANEVQQWLRKAQEDLAVARRAIADDLSEPGCFHCQQAVEKLLKAYLVWNESAPPRVHDLALLLDGCEKLDPAFRDKRDEWEWLTGYAIIARYPSEVPPPDQPEARRALAAAEDCWQSVQRMLPPETYPQKRIV
jgi:HEPN domain-containing protein